MTDLERRQSNKVSAGPYALEIPPNGVALLYEIDEGGTEHRLPGGVGYFEALIQFAGEVIRLRSMVKTMREEVRAEALEEAAWVCEVKARDYGIPVEADRWPNGCWACAGAIRSLKDKR